MKNLGYYLFVILMAFCLSSSLRVCAMDAQSPVPSVQTVTPSAVAPAPSAIEEQKKYQELRKESAENTALFSPFKVFSNLIVLVAVLSALAWLYNKYGKDAMAKFAVARPINKHAINVLSSASIGQGKYLHVVEVGGEKVLIGATANNISFLKEIKTEKVVSNE